MTAGAWGRPLSAANPLLSWVSTATSAASSWTSRMRPVRPCCSAWPEEPTSWSTRDSYLNIGAANQANWERLCHCIGRQDLLEDPRFCTNPERMQNLQALSATLEEIFVQESTAHWLEILEKAGVPSGPIYTFSEVYADPQVRARDMVVETNHPTAGPVQNIGIPIKLSETPGAIRNAAPTLGQHTDEILTDFGFSAAEVKNLREDGAVQ